MGICRDMRDLGVYLRVRVYDLGFRGWVLRVGVGLNPPKVQGVGFYGVLVRFFYYNPLSCMKQAPLRTVSGRGMTQPICV